MGLAAAIGVGPGGCGYRQFGLSEAPESARRVAIRTLKNGSTDPGAELVVTEALRREFIDRGELRVVRDAKSADWVIEGRLQPLQTRRETISSVVLVLEYTLIMSLDLRIRGADGRRIALDSTATRESELYLASADIEVTRKNRREAMRRLAALLAGRVHDAVVMEIAP